MEAKKLAVYEEKSTKLIVIDVGPTLTLILSPLVIKLKNLRAWNEKHDGKDAPSPFGKLVSDNILSVDHRVVGMAITI